MSDCFDVNYAGREQSQIKHIILEKYLERFAVITGKWCSGIIYVDGFSGPWNVQSESLDDASFSIAVRQLRRARDTVRPTFKKDLQVKCLFLEKDPHAFERLKTFAAAQKDVDVVALNQEFERAIPELVNRIKAAGTGYFPFIFIDPTGWKGFAMNTIAPLLRLQPSEVLVNFMTGFIVRFAEDARAGIDASFQETFGDAEFRECIRGLVGPSREDALVFEYARRISQTGNFRFTPVTVVPHPTKDRTHFHLVYGTRHIRGLQVFKEAERSALNMTGRIRGEAKRREREARSGQPEFFGGADFPDADYVGALSTRYQTQAREAVHHLIRTKKELSFDDVCGTALAYPTVQLDSARAWVNEIADVANLGPLERVAKMDAGHRVKLRESSNRGELNLGS